VKSMKSTDSRLFVDVGQTGSRVHDVRGVRHSISRAFTPGTQIEALLRDVLSEVNESQASTVVMSLTGLRGKVPALTDLASVCVELTGCSSLGVCDDGLAWSVGSLGGNDGVALAVGGGVVAVARQDDRFVHLDGNGSDFGDSGSAYWLGRKGLRCAIRALEGSGRHTSLGELFTQKFGPHDEFVRSHIVKDEIHKAFIAFSSDVLQSAEAGDAAAAEIVATGAERLGSLAVAAARQAGLGEAEARVALGGGLMRNNSYRKLVSDGIKSYGDNFDVVEPLGDALDGLVLLEQLGRKNIMSLMSWWSA